MLSNYQRYCGESMWMANALQNVQTHPGPILTGDFTVTVTVRTVVSLVSNKALMASGMGPVQLDLQKKFVVKPNDWSGQFSEVNAVASASAKG